MTFCGKSAPCMCVEKGSSANFSTRIFPQRIPCHVPKTPSQAPLLLWKCIDTHNNIRDLMVLGGITQLHKPNPKFHRSGITRYREAYLTDYVLLRGTAARGPLIRWLHRRDLCARLDNGANHLVRQRAEFMTPRAHLEVSSDRTDLLSQKMRATW